MAAWFWFTLGILVGATIQGLLILYWIRQDPMRLVQVIRSWVLMFAAIGERHIILSAGLVDMATASKFPVYVTPEDYLAGLEHYVNKLVSDGNRASQKNAS